jgi:hypothetical protein
MIINLLNKIPLRIYQYIIIFSIIVSGLIGAYMYFNMGFDTVYKSILIWYLVILELNFIHLFFILKFYESNLNKKGETGDIGKTGPRGFKGEDDMCRACDGDGTKNNVFAGTTSDRAIDLSVYDTIVGGQCKFPFINNYQYQYKCVNGDIPSGLVPEGVAIRDTDAKQYGWCATKIDSEKNPLEIGYCNENKSAAIKRKLRNKRTRDRLSYLQNNKGITDIKLVHGVTREDAAKKCRGDYKIHPQDLNEGTGGKFIYLCYKEGLERNGISDLRVIEHVKTCSDDLSERNISVLDTNLDGNIDGNQLCDKNGFDGYEIVKDTSGANLHLNKDSKGGESEDTKLYLYKKTGPTNFIKEIKIVKGDKEDCPTGFKNPGGDNFNELAKDLNKYSKSEDIEGITTAANQHILNMCVKITGNNIVSIDTAFVYKDRRLYVFRGEKFYRMKNKPINNILNIDKDYPKDISDKWFKKENASERRAKQCSIYNENEKACVKHINCAFDPSFNKCEPKANYNAVFTYGYDNKTYFFKGDKVYLYDDKKMSMASGFPKKINKVFKGIPDDIDAVFTWGNDGKTYFFKDNLYYKYNDKSNKTERGYPRKSITRWPGMPSKINAIFTLPFILDSSHKSKTYVIQGDDSYVIDDSTFKVEYSSKVSKIFNGLAITTTDISTPTLATLPSTQSS